MKHFRSTGLFRQQPYRQAYCLPCAGQAISTTYPPSSTPHPPELGTANRPSFKEGPESQTLLGLTQ